MREADKVRAETDRNVAAAVVGQRENELDLAGNILARTRQLFQQKSVEQNQLDKDQSAEQTAKAQVASASHSAGRVMSRRTKALQSFTWSASRCRAQTDLVDVLGRFDPKSVKTCPSGERAEDQ